MVGFLVTHELDAVKRHEWRIFPVLGLLTDKAGERIFIWLHVPIFAVLLFLADGNAVNRVRVGLAAFAIVHVGLHWICRTHPANEFNNASSWALILGTGAMGATYLVAAGMM
jgi:hypothetical protein